MSGGPEPTELYNKQVNWQLLYVDFDVDISLEGRYKVRKTAVSIHRTSIILCNSSLMLFKLI